MNKFPMQSSTEEYRHNPLACTVVRCQLTFYGHVVRIDPTDPAHTYTLYSPLHGKRRPGRQRMDYLKYIQDCMAKNVVVDCCAAKR
jgi:hypothetical protein